MKIISVINGLSNLQSLSLTNQQIQSMPPGDQPGPANVSLNPGGYTQIPGSDGTGWDIPVLPDLTAANWLPNIIMVSGYDSQLNMNGFSFFMYQFTQESTPLLAWTPAYQATPPASDQVYPMFSLVVPIVAPDVVTLVIDSDWSLAFTPGSSSGSPPYLMGPGSGISITW